MLLAAALDALIAVLVVSLIGRAVLKLLADPDTPHDELVPSWERRWTTALGIPIALVGVSSMVDGPLAVPGINPLTVSILGIVLSVYPNFAPSVH